MLNESAASRVQANLKELFSSNLAPGNAYVKFQLADDLTALLSMDQVQESLIVAAEQITTLPSMPKSALGIMSSRDRVFCVFDLSQLLNLASSLVNPRQYQIIVLQTTTEPAINVGLAVNQLQGIVRFLDQDIVSASLDTGFSSLVDCVSGTVQQGASIISILSFDSILATIDKSQLN